MLVGLFINKLYSEGLKKSNTLRTLVLVEAGAAQDTGSCLPYCKTVLFSFKKCYVKIKVGITVIVGKLTV